MSTEEALVAILIPVVFMLSVAGVILLRPLTKPLARYLESLTRDQETGAAGPVAEQLREQFSHLEARLSLLEERQNFTDALLAGQPRREALPPHPGAEGGPPS